MKKIIIPFLIGLLIFVSCQKEIAKTPDRLIEKDKMVDIMYDLSLLGAMRSQNPALLDSFKNNSNTYIYKKHKIDSVQFAQSNIYYAADFKEYKNMFERVKLRLEKSKKMTEAAIRNEKKKTDLSDTKSVKSDEKTKTDSIEKAKLNTTKATDSIKKRKRSRFSHL